ncbi:MAG: lysophospholipid acyltransferase family protein [Bacillota bacterium]
MRLKDEIGRLALKLIFYPRYHFKFTYKDFNPKRKDPYFLIANHASLNDPLYVGINLIEYPYPVTGNLLYTNPTYNFLLTRIVKTIAKRKGQSDIQTIKGIFNAFNHDHRGIMIFPEGNASYFGEQSDVSLYSTAKLVKKVRHEVVLAKINGGYLAAPRWGKRRKKGDFHIHYEPLITIQELEALSINQIEDILKNAIKFNDYDWNRKELILYRSKEKAVGLEKYVYFCPKCKGIQTISTQGNDIFCQKCGKISHINHYEFLEDLPFDNLVDWGKLQKKSIPFALQNELHSQGRLIEIDFKHQKRHIIGDMDITLNKKMLRFENKKQQHHFDVDHIEGLVLTQKNFLSFDYDEKTYLTRINDPMLFLDSINYIKGE